MSGELLEDVRAGEITSGREGNRKHCEYKSKHRLRAPKNGEGGGVLQISERSIRVEK